MTTFRGHYLPVEARREVLRIYRDRRVNGVLDLGPRPTALDSMRATVRHFEGWLAYAVAFGPIGRHDVKSLTDQYRAAEYYLDRLCQKPEDLRFRRTSYLRVQMNRERRQQLEASS